MKYQEARVADSAMGAPVTLHVSSPLALQYKVSRPGAVGVEQYICLRRMSLTG
jgi:hypothetical protein